MATLEEMKAAFAAKGGTVTVAAPGLAYGVSPRADKEKRQAARDNGYWSESAIERRSETEMQRAREENGYYKS